MSNSNESVLVKKPHLKVAYTAAQLEEFAKCADPVTGPEYFCRNFFYIQHPTKGKMLYAPYDFQVDLLNTYHQNRKSCTLVSRQMGKCLSGGTLVKVSNKKTSKQYFLPAEIFHEYISAVNNGKEPIDISQYETKEM